MQEAIQKTATKIADDLRAHWNLRRRGDQQKLRPDEIKIMAAQERYVDNLIAKRIRALIKQSTMA